MIKYVNDKGKANLEFDGSFSDATADVMMLINILYNVFYDVDPAEADIFSGAVVGQVILNNDAVFLRRELNNVHTTAVQVEIPQRKCNIEDNAKDEDDDELGGTECDDW